MSRAIGRVIRTNRLRLKLSQEDFAEKTGHHRTYIGIIERGERNPTAYTLLLIARAVEKRASDLLREAGF